MKKYVTFGTKTFNIIAKFKTYYIIERSGEFYHSPINRVEENWHDELASIMTKEGITYIDGKANES